MMADQSLRWRKSSHSGAHGDCVELAALPGGAAVRDSKDPSGPMLVLSRRELAGLLDAARR